MGEEVLVTELEHNRREFGRALLLINRLVAKRLVPEAGDAWTPIQLVEKWIVPALQSIGARWEQGKAALSPIYIGSHIGEIPWQVPEKVLEAISEAVHKWGRYPLDRAQEYVR